MNCYWRKKITRVLLPYAIIISIFAISPIPIWKEQTIGSYLLDITGLFTSYWYIGFLIKAYFVYWITSLLCKRYQTAFFLIYAAFVLVMFRNTEAEQALSFPLGMLASKHIDYIRLISKQKIKAGLTVCFIVGFLFLFLKQVPSVRQYETYWFFHLVQLLIKLPLAIGFIAASAFFPRLCAHAITQFIGKISYEMYLLQMPFYGMASKTIVRCIIYIIGLFSFAWLFQRLNHTMHKALMNKISSNH